MKLAGDPLLRRPVCAAGQPARPQVDRGIGLSASDREIPRMTDRSGTQRARACFGEHQIRRSGQVVQDRLPRVVDWADILGLSTCVAPVQRLGYSCGGTALIPAVCFSGPSLVTTGEQQSWQFTGQGDHPTGGICPGQEARNATARPRCQGRATAPEAVAGVPLCLGRLRGARLPGPHVVRSCGLFVVPPVCGSEPGAPKAA